MIYSDQIQALRFRFKKIYHAFIQNVKHFVSIPMQNVKATSTNLFSPNGQGVYLGLGLSNAWQWAPNHHQQYAVCVLSIIDFN